MRQKCFFPFGLPKPRKMQSTRALLISFLRKREWPLPPFSFFCTPIPLSLLPSKSAKGKRKMVDLREEEAEAFSFPLAGLSASPGYTSSSSDLFLLSFHSSSSTVQFLPSFLPFSSRPFSFFALSFFRRRLALPPIPPPMLSLSSRDYSLASHAGPFPSILPSIASVPSGSREEGGGIWYCVKVVLLRWHCAGLKFLLCPRGVFPEGGSGQGARKRNI